MYSAKEKKKMLCRKINNIHGRDEWPVASPEDSRLALAGGILLDLGIIQVKQFQGLQPSLNCFSLPRRCRYVHPKIILLAVRLVVE